jgi:hypothetical protein
MGPEYDMDAYVATFFGGEALGRVLRVGLSKKPSPTLHISLENILHD